MPISLPERLQTRRLTLREPREADALPIFEAYTQDEEVARYLVWRPHQTVQETENFISYCMEAWRSGRTRPYVITRHGDEDVPIGMLEARIAPHSVDIASLARAYGCEHRVVRTKGELDQALSAPPLGLSIVEVPLER